MTLAEVESCAKSFPPERRTVTLCGSRFGVELEAELAAKIGGITGWRSPASAEQLNLAVARGRAPYIVLVDADTALAEPEMLDLALAHLTKGAAVVTPLLTTGETIYAAGYAFGIAKPYLRYNGWPADHERAQRPLMVQAGPLACLFTSRAAWRVTGGLVKQFEHRPLVEIPYCLHLRSKGAPVVYEPAIRAETAASATATPQAAKEGLQILMQLGRPQYDEWALL